MPADQDLQHPTGVINHKRSQGRPGTSCIWIWKLSMPSEFVGPLGLSHMNSKGANCLAVKLQIGVMKGGKSANVASTSIPPVNSHNKTARWQRTIKSYLEYHYCIKEPLTAFLLSRNRHESDVFVRMSVHINVEKVKLAFTKAKLYPLEMCVRESRDVVLCKSVYYCRVSCSQLFSIKPLNRWK